MARINIQFTRFSAFYSPLIATAAGGFLAEEGLEPEFSISPPGVSAIAALLDGSAHVVQSAPSQGLSSLEKGEEPAAVHFAQVNQKDGFFLTARQPDADFTWSKLAGKRVLVDHGGQPLAMFKYACKKQGLDYELIEAVNAGNVGEMDAAFRAGEGDYIHQQGPAPQQLEHDGVGHIVAGLGDAIGVCAFSSLAATRDWLGTDMARAFTRAFKKAREWVATAPPAEIAAAERDHFTDIDPAVLASTIAAYQRLGNWAGPIAISREAFEVTRDVFRNVGRNVDGDIYPRIVAPPPGS